MKEWYSHGGVTIYNGDSLSVLRELPSEYVDCCVTSPPYWGLRDYGTDGQIGLEQTPQEYVAKMVGVFEEVKRVLRDDGTLWLNLGDSYGAVGGDTHSGFNKRWSGTGGEGSKQDAMLNGVKYRNHETGVRPKNLIGIPWRVAFALQEAGWYLRQDIIWCLSGGTWLYAKTQKGDAPMMVRDVARLDPATVKLWNGKKWTQLLGTSMSARQGTELEIVLRSGERFSCTPTHRFPTIRGLLEAGEIRVGDCLTGCQLPEPSVPRDSEHCGMDAAWLAGLYLAEGSRSNNCIQIAGHTREVERWERCKKIAASYGGSATKSDDGNNQSIRLYGKMLVALIEEFVSGKTSKDKCFATVCWRHSNAFIREMLMGYLSGDGHYDRKNDRWRLGFTRNYNLERDLRTACARLGYQLTLKPKTTKYNGEMRPVFKGEIRVAPTRKHKNRLEVIEIRKSKCRNVYDLGVEDEPHLFAMASGVLTHNSKPNPMPESVTDRCTKAHEYIFLLSKKQRYYYDSEAIKEPISPKTLTVATVPYKGNGTESTGGKLNKWMGENGGRYHPEKANKRSVWSVSSRPYKEAHFATFPPDLIEPCILAGCPEGGVVLDPFIGSGTTAMVSKYNGRNCVGIELNEEYCSLIPPRVEQGVLF